MRSLGWRSGWATCSGATMARVTRTSTREPIHSPTSMMIPLAGGVRGFPTLTDDRGRRPRCARRKALDVDAARASEALDLRRRGAEQVFRRSRSRDLSVTEEED